MKQYKVVRIDERESSCQEIEKLAKELSVDVLLVVGKISDRICVSCLSLTEDIRALELIDYAFGQFGLAKGTARYATGTVSEILLSTCMSEREIFDVTDYFEELMNEYYTRCDTIEAASFASQNPERLSAMKEYQKAAISWAYVKTTDIVPEGYTLCVRTLENDTGVQVRSAKETYIMIGCLGEVYQIHKDKFESSYVVTDEKLDIFTQMLDFIPAVECVDDGAYLTIDEQAHLCYPKPGASILAEKLEKRTRVFSKNGDYFLGKPGDYLAVRKDDSQDVYIIQEEVFGRTYCERDSLK